MRIAGITIPEKKRLEIGLTSVYGIGASRAANILHELSIDPGKRPGKLSEEEEAKIRKKVDSFIIEGELRRTVSGDIKRLKDIQSYRGTRHSKRLPVRGQRTKTNSRTVRGNVRNTMTSGKKKVEKK